MVYWELILGVVFMVFVLFVVGCLVVVLVYVCWYFIGVDDFGVVVVGGLDDFGFVFCIIFVEGFYGIFI